MAMKLSRKRQTRSMKGSKFKIGRFCMACFVPSLVIFQVVLVSVLHGGTFAIFRCYGDKVPQQILVSPSNNASERLRMRLEVELQHHQSFSPCGTGQEASCNTTLDRVWAYNPWSRNQYLCGQTIPPSKAVELMRCCQEGPRVFPQEPTITNIQLDEPIDLTEKQKVPIRHTGVGRRGPAGSRQQSYSKCTVPCQRQEPVPLLADFQPKGLNWEIRHTLESSHQYRQVAVLKDSWKHDLYYSTTSFKSEVRT